MALINGALQIGRNAITASQAALTVTGNNMANSATEGYSRQQVHLAPTQGMEVVPGKYSGTGVILYDIQRQVDEALNGRINIAVGDSASYMIQQQAMTRVEAAFNELTDADLSTRLNAFFNAFSALQSQPQDMAKRNVVLQEGNSLSNYIRQLRTELGDIREDLDTRVRYQVSEANDLARQIAELNGQVAAVEAGRFGSAAALRDQRDKLVKQLSELVNITTREANGSSINVFIGNEPLIQYADARGLTYQETMTDDGTQLAQVVFSDNQESVSLSSGKIHGLIAARDDQVGQVITDLDNWTKALVFEVNKLHSLGQGLDGLSSVQSVYGVDDADASLADTSASGLPWAVDNGVFYVRLYDSNGQIIRTEQLKVTEGMDSNDTTMNSLVTALNNIDGIDASLDGLNRLQISATTSGQTFAFAAPDDSDAATNVLAALGIGGFFSGQSAADIAVKSDLAADARKLAASATGMAGNGEVARRIAQLASDGVDSLGGSSITESYNSLAGRIASDSKAAQDNYKAADVAVQTLEMERESISGVSMDEEAIHMITFQRAFQGAARYVNLINQMMDDVLSLVR